MPARVKVYQLNAEGQWEDKGTGNVNHYIANDGDGDFVILTVIDEESEDILLEHRIEVNIEYTRQGGTIITWSEPKEIDLALSFQETPQCEEVWDQITSAQRSGANLNELRSSEDQNEENDLFSNSNNHNESMVTMFPLPEISNISELEKKILSVGLSQKAALSARFLSEGFLKQLFLVFKKCEQDNLLTEAQSVFNFVKTMFLLNDQNLIEKLTNEENILDIIACLEYDPLLLSLSSAFSSATISASTTTPATTTATPSFHRHRDFLLKKAVFKEPIPIQKQEVISRIHLTYRITYIKDVILLRYLDDPTIGTLNTLIFFNNVNLLTGLLEDVEWMKSFFSELHRLAGFSFFSSSSISNNKSSGNGKASSSSSENNGNSSVKRKETGTATTEKEDSTNTVPITIATPTQHHNTETQGEKEEQQEEEEEEEAETTELENLEKSFQRKNLFLFLQELCLVVKSMQPAFRTEFYKNISEYGVFRAIEDALASCCPPTSEESWLWLASADILTNSLIHDPNFLRSYLISRLPPPTTTNTATATTATTTAAAANTLLGCLIDGVCSPSVDSGLADQLAQVLRMVLDPDSMPEDVDKANFLDYFYLKQVPKLVTTVSRPLRGNCNAQYQACELLSYCVHRHGQRIKQYILNNNITTKVSMLLLSHKSNIVCTAIRFLRSCLGVKDIMIARQISNEKVLDKLIDVFAMNGARYNLLNSAVIELIHFIRQENIKVLVEYLVNHHEEKFKGIEYVQTFQELKLRHEQNQEHYRSRGGSRSHKHGSGGNTSLLLDGGEYSYFEKDSDDENDASRKVEDDEEKRNEFKMQTEMLLQKRPRSADDEADLVPRTSVVPKRKPSKQINIAVGKRSSQRN